MPVTKQPRREAFAGIGALIVSLVTVVVVFVPFAFNTSPLDAVTLRVPENQDNWWHALVGAPFFLAFPLVLVRVRTVLTEQPLKRASYRAISIIAGLCVCGTIAVETPFLLHLAGTSDWQRAAVLSLGFGIIIASAATLFWRRASLNAYQVCVTAINTAYLANAALCLVVYSDATGPVQSRSGWLVTMVVVWPMAFELVWTYIDNFRRVDMAALQQS